MSGRVIAVVGPSGAGKDTLIAGLCAAQPELTAARRTITRPREPFEDHEPVSDAEFAALQAQGAFALHWAAHGLHYGLRQSVFAAGDVVFNGSRAALAQAQAAFAQLEVVVISVAPEHLAARLKARGREAEAAIAARLARAQTPLPEGLRAVEIGNNGAPEQAIAALVAALYPRNG